MTGICFNIPRPHRLLLLGMTFATLWTFIALSGCSEFNGTRLEKYVGGETNLIKFSYKIAEHLTERAMPPLVPYNNELPLLVTTFVDNNDLAKTSHFGRVLQEHISSRLVQLGYTVKELKLADSLKIQTKSGETILTRDLSKIKDVQQVQAILVGTISRSSRVLYISTRMINPNDATILSSDDFRLVMDDNILAMFGLQRTSISDDPVSEPHRPFF